jgi:tRNA modification GTPase
MFAQGTGWTDTIVALATPPGIGALGIIRLSGTNAITIVDNLFPKKKLAAQPSHTVHVGFLQNDDTVLDEVVVTLYKTPRSYTGEDVVEISAHGSPFIQQKIIAACIEKGARLAKPGEFTQRAFLAGKLDLAQAEAVADVIAADTDAAQKAALTTMRGGFSQLLHSLRDRLISFSALIELELDFAQEDVTFADRTALNDLLTEALATTQNLRQSFGLGNVIKNGVSVAIVGKPNAGKSTLLNVLLNDDRAIVSDIPGTTRDTIEETINIEGILFRLIDTAGIRSHTTDVIESAGIEKSRQKISAADLVLYLFDAATETADTLQHTITELQNTSGQILLVGNKTDATDARPQVQEQPTLFIAAKSGDGIEALKKEMVATVLQGKAAAGDVVVTNARHAAALNSLYDALTEVQEGLAQNIPGDLLALDIRRCLHYLGEITGTITNEDQLDYIFSKFCIGK